MSGEKPEKYGRYEVGDEIGKGGMAVVYHARDPRLDREVAIKVILPDQQQEEHFLKRFEREARVLARLTHPNIVPIIDYGEQDGVPYLVMPYLPGGSLKERISGAIPFAEAAHILAPIARALHAAHQEGIVHRDIKPSNMLMTRTGEVMLTDFGIARLVEGDTPSDLTASGTSLGTPDYMSPEQVQGHPVDSRSDIYSLGAVLYEMVTGRKPYEADTPLSMALKRVTEPLPAPRSYKPDLPEEAEQVLCRALEKSPNDRYPDMAAFADALERLQHTAVSTLPVPAVKADPQAQPETPPATGKKPPIPDAVSATGGGEAKKPGLLSGKRKWFVIIPLIMFLCLVTAICLGGINSANQNATATAAAAAAEAMDVDMADTSIDITTRLAFALTTTPGMLSTPEALMETEAPSMEKMEACLHWDEITDEHIGQVLCVSGEVITSYSTQRGDIITYSNDPDDFFLVSYDELMKPAPGTCILVRGVVRQLGMVPVMLVTPNNMVECPAENMTN